MGVDTIVLAEHHVDDLEEVLGLLKTGQDIFTEHMSAFWKPTSWATSNPSLDWYWDTEFSEMNFRELYGPAGFSLHFGPNSLYKINGPRWNSFIDDPAMQIAVESVCLFIGQVFKSKKLIYVPDSAYPASAAADKLWDFSSFSALENWLRHTCHEPAEPPSKIHLDSTDSDGYYVYDV